MPLLLDGACNAITEVDTDAVAGIKKPVAEAHNIIHRDSAKKNY